MPGWKWWNNKKGPVPTTTGTSASISSATPQRGSPHPGSEGWIVKIRNNYNRISYNLGPTLLTWLETNDPEAYELVTSKPTTVAGGYGSHGNASPSPQPPHSALANHRDKVTQVYWGVQDFEYRFGATPGNMARRNGRGHRIARRFGCAWPAVHRAGAPASGGAQTGDTARKLVDAESIDTRRPYWCQLPSGRRIALYFYHGRLAQEVAFNGLLNNGQLFAERLLRILDDSDTPQLAHIATDGESYGHHHRFGEMALASALTHIEDNNLATLTNYGQFLELFPPEYEVQIHETSSRLCPRGRSWRNDCGCNTGGNPGWHQRWRKPLRETLDWLRDRLAPAYEKEVGRFLKDPWKARNDYIRVHAAPHRRGRAGIFKTCAPRTQQTRRSDDPAPVLEMQRYAVLMYTSCGWFLDEILGIETNQILQYALRAMDHAQDSAGAGTHAEFEKRLRHAPSNNTPTAQPVTCKRVARPRKPRA
ncbi:MAG: DUF3536 domain-containing protein [Lewinellaceae bacterium]|nr:DUF3536 domain-containing protein [Lewinellaceae bacterium]